MSVFERDSDAEISLSFFLSQFEIWREKLISKLKKDIQLKSGRCGSTNLISETEKKTAARDPGKRPSQETERPQVLKMPFFFKNKNVQKIIDLFARGFS